MKDPHRLIGWLEAQRPAAFEILRELVGINSYTRNRAGVLHQAELTAARFAPLGFTAEHVPSDNPAYGDHLFLRRPHPGGPSLALVSHLDTVFPPEEEERNAFRWQPEGDRIFGPGTVDIKGGTVLALVVLQALQALAPRVFDSIDWLVALNASEETESAHFGCLTRERIPTSALAALVFEGETPLPGRRRVVLARKGRLTFRVKVSGRAAHAGGKPHRGASAIRQLARLIERIESMNDPDRRLTFNIGTISGGVSVNRVPHEAVADGEFRCFDPAVQQQTRTALEALAGVGDVRAASDGWACRTEISFLNESPPWPRNPGTDRLHACWQAAAADLDQVLEPEERGGISDGNLLCHHVPTLDGLGPAGDNDHCSERSADGSKLPEFMDATSFVPKAALNVMGILRLVDGERLLG
ncbi:MAG: M20/M25/M40 family metallo-hydrolase [Verrucomicrobiales bacterium]|nr:M20/M25/M40 family metallo-hydrolase [Verrucomicrobiales bacterium]